MIKLYYPAIFHPEKTGYSVTVPDIDGCFSEGDTLEEAIEMTCDAIGLCLEECGENYPVPSNPADIKTEPGDFVSLVPFDLLQYRRKHDTRAVKKTLTIPSWLNVIAEENHINFSSVLQTALKEQLHIN
jgi:predicted RNase H-like HicB family nuclease